MVIGADGGGHLVGLDSGGLLLGGCFGLAWVCDLDDCGDLCDGSGEIVDGGGDGGGGGGDRVSMMVGFGVVVELCCGEFVDFCVRRPVVLCCGCSYSCYGVV